MVITCLNDKCDVSCSVLSWQENYMNEWAVKYMCLAWLRWVLDGDQGADPEIFQLKKGWWGDKGGLKWKLWENCQFIHVQNVHKHKYVKQMNKLCNCFSLFCSPFFCFWFVLFYHIFICFLKFKAGM